MKKLCSYLVILPLLLISHISFSQIVFSSISVAPFSCDNNGQRKGRVTLNTTGASGSEIAILYKGTTLVQAKNVTSDALLFDSLIVAPDYGINYSIVISTESTHDIVYPTTWPAQSVVTITPNANLICSGNQVSLQASNALNYLWDDGQASTTVSKNPKQTTTYYVTGTFSNGCKYTASHTVEVSSPDLIVVANPASISSGQSTELTVSGGTNYSWSDGLGNNSKVTVTPTFSRMYNVSGYDGNGCKGTVYVSITVDNKSFTPISSIIIKDTTVLKGSQFTLNPIVTPVTASIKTYNWSSGNGGVANVNSQGVISANLAGNTTISCTATDGSGASAICFLEIINSIVPITEITSSVSEVVLPRTEIFTPELTVLPTNATYKDVILTSSNSSVADITVDGKILAKNVGECIVTISSVKNPAVKTTITVVVKESNSLTIIDFESGAISSLGTLFHSNNDSENGGLSYINPLVIEGAKFPLVANAANETDSAVYFAYTLSQGLLSYNPYVFVGVKLVVNDVAGDLSEYTGIEFWYKGNQSDMQLQLSTTQSDFCAFYKTIPYTPTWTKYLVLWSDLTQYTWGKQVAFDPSEIMQLQWQVQANNGSTGEIWIDEIKAKGNLLTYKDVTTLSLQKTSIDLTPLDEFNLIATVLPVNASVLKVNWSSTNSSVASVDENGKVIALAPGTTVINAVSASDTTVKSHCVVTVQGPILVSSISTNVLNTLYVKEGFSDSSPRVILAPSNATNKSVVWETSNSTIAQVSQDGIVKGTSQGTALITVTSVENPTLNASFNVEVLPIDIDKTKLKSLIGEVNFIVQTIEPSELGTSVGQYSATLFANLETKLQVAQSVFDNISVTQVDVDNAYFDLQNARSDFNYSLVSPVLISSITLSSTSIELNSTTKEYLLIASVLPQNASNNTLNWESSDDKVVQVNNGIINVVGGGVSTISVTATDGSGVVANCMVTVIVPVSEIVIQEVLGINEGESATISTLLLPENATNKTLVWSSSNTSIATVNSQGKVFGVSEGAAKIIAINQSGDVSAVCVVNVSKSIIPLSSIKLPEYISVLQNQVYKLQPSFVPVNAIDTSLYWKSTNTSSLVIDEYGVLTALDVDTVTVLVFNHDSTIVETSQVIIRPSELPVVAPVKNITVKVGTQIITIPLNELISDDNTTLNNLVFTPQANDDFAITINQDTLQVTPINPDADIVGNIIVFVTDLDGQTSTIELPITVSSAPNKAPILIKVAQQNSMAGSSFMPLNLPLYVVDDYTLQKNIKWSVAASNNLKASVLFSTLYVEPKVSSWTGLDSLLLTATDEDGAASTEYIYYSVTNVINKAPIISLPPLQEQTNLYTFQDLILSNFVDDDFTPSKYIIWSVSESDKLSITISNGIAKASVIDRNWKGVEVIEFTATDNQGLSSSEFVVYNQQADILENTWSGKPEVSFIADRTLVGVNQNVYFHGSITGEANDGLEWTFENGTPLNSYDLNPIIKYATPSINNVIFVAGNVGLIDSAKQENYISILGITTPDTIVCMGSVVHLQYSDASLNSYEWSSGQVTSNVDIAVASDTIISVIARKGLYKFYDTISITINKPIELGVDYSLCSGSQKQYDIDGYTSYKWNNNSALNTGQYTSSNQETITVEADDEYGCKSFDTVNVTLLNLPTVSLGNDQEICDNTSMEILSIVNAVSPLVYNWNTSENTPSITVDTTGEYILQIVDGNNCKNSDTIQITVLKPYAEQIGVATFAKANDAILIAWERTLGKRTASYEIQREIGSLGTYETLGTLPFSVESVFEDTDANSLNKSFKYRLVTIDSTCGNKAYSEPHKTILVQNSVNSDGKANLSWNAYEGTTFNTYRIQRGTTQADLIQVDSVASDVTSWTDTEIYQKGWIYRVGVVLLDTVKTKNPILKAESGPFILAISNISEAEANTSIAAQVSSIQVFPVKDEQVIQINFKTFELNVEVEILSINGESKMLIKENNIETMRIPTNSFTAGTYIIIVKTDKEYITTRFVIK